MDKQAIKAFFVIDSNRSALGLFGRRDEHLKLIEDACDVKIVARGTDLLVEGHEPHVARALSVLEDLSKVLKVRPYITAHDVRASLDAYDIRVLGGEIDSFDGESSSVPTIGDINGDLILVTTRGHRITPRSVGQKAYADAMRSHEMVFCVGPAGTGKTYMAVAMAVNDLKKRKVKRIILTRPAVEAGESLGFLPGDLQEKVDPYLRPLYDALFDILGEESFHRNMERNIIEVAPLAYMRGRTLDDAFIILDEAQNTTPKQMQMFLTRMGFGSKVVVTGDDTQIDLPDGKKSGLIEVQTILKDIEGIAFVTLSEKDVVRHELVRKIIMAYDNHARVPVKDV